MYLHLHFSEQSHDLVKAPQGNLSLTCLRPMLYDECSLSLSLPLGTAVDEVTHRDACVRRECHTAAAVAFTFVFALAPPYLIATLNSQARWTHGGRTMEPNPVAPK